MVSWSSGPPRAETFKTRPRKEPGWGRLVPDSVTPYAPCPLGTPHLSGGSLSYSRGPPGPRHGTCDPGGSCQFGLGPPRQCHGASQACRPSGGSPVTLSASDPVVASLAQDIFKELSQIEACQGPMQMRLIPTLVSIMQAPADKLPAGLCAVSGGAAPHSAVRPPSPPARGSGPPPGPWVALAALRTWACLGGASVSWAEHPRAPRHGACHPAVLCPDTHRPPRPVE